RGRGGSRRTTPSRSRSASGPARAAGAARTATSGALRAGGGDRLRWAGRRRRLWRWRLRAPERRHRLGGDLGGDAVVKAAIDGDPLQRVLVLDVAPQAPHVRLPQFEPGVDVDRD